MNVTLGPASTFIVARLSWQWLYYIISILTAFSFLMIVFFVPETRWQRSAAGLGKFA